MKKAAGKASCLCEAPFGREAVGFSYTIPGSIQLRCVQNSVLAPGCVRQMLLASSLGFPEFMGIPVKASHQVPEPE